MNHHPGSFLWSLISIPDSMVAPEGKVRLKKSIWPFYVCSQQAACMCTFAHILLTCPSRIFPISRTPKLNFMSPRRKRKKKCNSKCYFYRQDTAKQELGRFYSFPFSHNSDARALCPGTYLTLCSLSFMSMWHKWSSERKEPQLRECLHKIGM